jgi:hypothetical protein
MFKRQRLRIFCTTEEDEASLHREKQKELFDLSSLKRFAYLFLGVASALFSLGGAKFYIVNLWLFYMFRQKVERYKGGGNKKSEQMLALKSHEGFTSNV